MCKWKQKCKFNKRQICVFKHDHLVASDKESNDDGIKKLKI